MTAERIVSEALSLPPQARAFVAERLIESLDTAPETEISSEWIKEIQTRCLKIDNGEVELSNSADVFTKAHSQLG